jgi:membrane fusion protein, multidrug efflux system
MNLRSVTAPARADVTTSPQPDPDSQPSAAAATPQRGRRFVLGLGALLAVFGCAGYFYLQRGIESTDDAQIDADVLSVPARMAGTVRAVAFEDNQVVEAGQLLAELDDAPARARLAQADANLSAARAAASAAELQAALTRTNAISGLAVANASLRISTVGTQSSVAQIAEAQARVANATAKLAEADLNFQRTQRLFDQGAMTTSKLDQERTAQEVARSELARAQAALESVQLSREQAQGKVAEAQAKWSQSNQVEAVIREALARAEQAHAAIATAEAQRRLAELDMGYTRIYAPVAGVVSKRSINVGQNVSVGQGIVQLVPQVYWVTANFKETQLADMHVGQPVKISIDTYPGHPLSGKVQSFSAATGSRFALLPPDNASGNFTKVVQRVSVRIALDGVPGPVQLRPGMSVGVEVDTLAQPAAAATSRDRD